MPGFYLMSEMMKPSYTAVVLHEEHRHKLLMEFSIPDSWDKIAHHMTINMGAAGQGPAEHLIGQEATLVVATLAYDDRVMAVGVKTEVPSQNQIKHITLAVDRLAGGKPFHSNKLINWAPVTPMNLMGIVAEVAQGGSIIPPQI